MEDFDNSGKNSIFILSEKFRLPLNHPAAIGDSDPEWVGFIDRLAANGNKIYDDGHSPIYEHIG